MDPNYTATYNYSSNVSPDFASGAALAVFAAIMFFALIFVLIIYVYMAICLMKIAKKTNAENAWFAWIPILNVVLMLQIAKKPLWWLILFFVPLANIVAIVLVWMEIAKTLKKPDWLGILMIVPIANLIVAGYMAFSKTETQNSPIQPQPPATPIPPAATA